MGKKYIMDYIRSYVERDTPIPESEDIPAFDFLGSGFVDSMEFFAFIVAVEEKFDIEIKDDELGDGSLSTIGGMADFIERKISRKR